MASHKRKSVVSTDTAMSFAHANPFDTLASDDMDIQDAILVASKNNNSKKQKTAHVVEHEQNEDQDVKMVTNSKGAITHATSGTACLDLFFHGMIRGCTNEKLTSLLSQAWCESPQATLAIILNTRDCRQGKGEKEVAYQAMMWLRQHHPHTYQLNLEYFVQQGYFKDLLVLAHRTLELKLPCLKSDVYPHDEPLELQILAKQLQQDFKIIQEYEEKKSTEVQKPSISLAAKWAPSEKSTWAKHPDKIKSKLPLRLASLLFPQPSSNLFEQYRKFISHLRKYLHLVETKMCQNQWSRIMFEKVPGRAHHLLRKAFNTHTPELYDSYMKKVQEGKSKIKSAGLHPHEIIESYLNFFNRRHFYIQRDPEFKEERVDPTIEAQWNDMVTKLKDLPTGSLGKAIALVDVSGSMTQLPFSSYMNNPFPTFALRQNKNTATIARPPPINVAVTLGLIIAQLAKPPFANHILTFESQPKWFHLSGETLFERVEQLLKAPWGGSTNFIAAFELLLKIAVDNQVPPEDMPTTFFVFSDMQFDQAAENKQTNFQHVQHLYHQAGYTMPHLVFWNLAASTHDVPTSADQKNVSFLSGFSPQLMKHVMEQDDLNEITPFLLLCHVLKPYLQNIHIDERDMV
jgi:hypothetical protein